jgi:hypothetical protein
MLMRSISKASAAATAQATARSRIRSARTSRRSAKAAWNHEAANGTIRREDDGGGEYRTEERASPDFIDAGDALETLGAGFPLVFALASHLKTAGLGERIAYSRSRRRAALPFKPRR